MLRLLIAIVFLVPQIIFGGGILPLDSLSGPGRLFNYMSITKWSYEALLTITEFGQDIVTDSCWSLEADERKQLSERQKESCNCTGASLFKACQFPGISKFYDPAIDQPVKQVPQDPDNAPKAPPKPPSNDLAAQQQYQANLEQYQTDIETYLEQVSKYQTDLKDYTSWREEYESAIGQAEGIIERFQQKSGNAFDVNLPLYWSILAGLSGGMVMMIFAIQKYKDSMTFRTTLS